MPHTPHRPRITRTGLHGKPWRVECQTCTRWSDWRFWPNALSRALLHVRQPSVYS